MWFKSNFITPAVAAISFLLIGGSCPAAANEPQGRISRGWARPLGESHE